jgi:hypothetical protein
MGDGSEILLIRINSHYITFSSLPFKNECSINYYPIIHQFYCNHSHDYVPPFLRLLNINLLLDYWWWAYILNITNKYFWVFQEWSHASVDGNKISRRNGGLQLESEKWCINYYPIIHQFYCNHSHDYVPPFLRLQRC